MLLLSSGLSLPGPAITGYIVDKVFVRKDASKLDLLVGLLLAILLLSELVRIVQEGTHADLIKKAGEYRELFEANSGVASKFIS